MLDELGRRKGYTLVYCDRHGINAFFIANECLPDDFRPQPLDRVYRRLNWAGFGLVYPHDPTQRLIDPFNP